MTSINIRMFGIMFEVSLLVASLKISTFINKPLFIHTSEKLKFMWLHMPSLIQKRAHVKGQRSNHHIFKFQPNPSWAKKRPNRYTSFNPLSLSWYFLQNSRKVLFRAATSQSGKQPHVSRLYIILLGISNSQLIGSHTMKRVCLRLKRDVLES